MILRDIVTILDADVLYGEDLLNTEVHHACAADMMSDVLAFGDSSTVLLTGLCNPQVVRTAEMMDILCIVFVRNKTPNEQILDLAKSKGIAVLRTEHLMYSSCGLLYNKGLVGGE